MSLTLSPLFPPGARFSSHQTSEDVDRSICGVWIKKHKPLLADLGPAPGTTFPPFSHHLPYMKQRLSSSLASARQEAKWKSEPDLNSQYRCNSLEDDLNGHDEDYLFEFDIGSPASSEDPDGSDCEDKPLVNVIEGGDSSSPCSHRKESGVVVDGFSCIFGSNDSSLDRRSILRQFEDSRGISVRPEEWREKGALYLGGDLPTYSGQSSEGSTTPILAVSPQVVQECPYISPDSVIEEDSLLSEQDVCFQCATSHSFHQSPLPSPAVSGESSDISQDRPDTSNYENTREISQVKSETLEEEKETTDGNQPRTDDIMLKLSERVNCHSTPDQKLKIHPEITVSTAKLTNLLDKLGPIREDSDNNDDDEEEEEEEATPLRLLHQNSLDVRPRLRKCSSLRSSSTPSRTSSQRKIVR